MGKGGIQQQNGDENELQRSHKSEEINGWWESGELRWRRQVRGSQDRVSCELTWSEGGERGQDEVSNRHGKGFDEWL